MTRYTSVRINQKSNYLFLRLKLYVIEGLPKITMPAQDMALWV